MRDIKKETAAAISMLFKKNYDKNGNPFYSGEIYKIMDMIKLLNPDLENIHENILEAFTFKHGKVKYFGYQNLITQIEQSLKKL